MTLPRWTHIALQVADIEASIAFYAAHTPLELLDQREDANGFGAWLGHREQAEAPFILVLAQFFPGKGPYGDLPSRIGPFGHLGIELESRAAVDAAAASAEASGCLQAPAVDLPPPIGYVCMVNDPDGNTIEFSHNQGVYDFFERRA